jgi:hypothetical protein
MDLKGTRCDAGEWIHIVQDLDHWRAVVNFVVPFISLGERLLVGSE